MSSKPPSNHANNANDKPLSSDKPEILRSWKPKLFVFILCALSFYAGWQASRSYLVKECQALGGQVSFDNKTVLCER